MLNKLEAIIEDPGLYLLTLALVSLFSFAFGLAMGIVWAMGI